MLGMAALGLSLGKARRGLNGIGLLTSGASWSPLLPALSDIATVSYQFLFLMCILSSFAYLPGL